MTAFGLKFAVPVTLFYYKIIVIVISVFMFYEEFVMYWELTLYEYMYVCVCVYIYIYIYI